MNHVKIIREQAAEDRTFSFEETSPREGKEAFFAALESYIKHWKQEELPTPAPKPASPEPVGKAPAGKTPAAAGKKGGERMAPSRKRSSKKKSRR